MDGEVYGTAQVIVTVADGVVSKVTLLPYQSDAAWHSDTDGLRDWLLARVWEPLSGLPDNVVWEG